MPSEPTTTSEYACACEGMADWIRSEAYGITPAEAMLRGAASRLRELEAEVESARGARLAWRERALEAEGSNEKLHAENAELEQAIAFAIGRLESDSDGCPPLNQLAISLRKLANERAAWIEVVIEHNKQCQQLVDPSGFASLLADRERLEAIESLRGKDEAWELSPLTRSLELRKIKGNRLAEYQFFTVRSAINAAKRAWIDRQREGVKK